MSIWDTIKKEYKLTKGALEKVAAGDTSHGKEGMSAARQEKHETTLDGIDETEITRRLQQMDGYEFESFIAELWQRRGWDVKTTGHKDRGIDVIATKSGPYDEKEVIQAKRYRAGNSVTSPDIQQYASLRDQVKGVDKVIVVCTSSFTDDALEVAEDINVKPVDGRKLAQMVIDNRAIDLVKKYTDPAGPEVEPVQPQEGSKSGKAQSAPDKEQEPLTIVERGDSISVELVGLEDVKTSIPSAGISPLSMSELDGVMAAMKLFNHSDQELPFREQNEFIFKDNQGATYIPANLGKGSFPGGWQKHGGSFGEMDPVFAQPGSNIKYIVGVSMPSHVKVSSIQLKNFDVAIQLDHEARNRLPGLPEEVKSEI